MAGLAKFRDRDDLSRAVTNYRILPPSLVPQVARGLPILETLAGIFLLFGVVTTAAAALLVCLLLGFIVAMTVNLFRQREMDCGCFGRSVPERLTWSTVGRNAVLVAGGVLVAGWSPRALAALPVWVPSLDTFRTTDSLGLLIVCTTCVLSWRVAVETRSLLRLSADHSIR